MKVITEQVEAEIGKKELKALRKAVGEGPVIIMTRNNPDPDGLASGQALSWLLDQAWGVTSRRIYYGTLDQDINRAMVRILTPSWKHGGKSLKLEQYTAVALVDTQPEALGNYLPDALVPDIVFDHHHSIHNRSAKVKYADLRTAIGSTATLIYQHLLAANVDLSECVATALFFAIKVKTHGLTRNFSSADVAAYLDLHPQIEPKILSRVEYPKIPKADYSGFVLGILNARVYGKAMAVNLGLIHRSGFTADIANLLVRIERINGVLCTGLFKGKLYVSLRIDRRKQDANLLLHDIVSGLGVVGGDRHSAEASIPLKDDIAQDAILEGQVTERFISLLGQDGGEPYALVS